MRHVNPREVGQEDEDQRQGANTNAESDAGWVWQNCRRMAEVVRSIASVIRSSLQLEKLDEPREFQPKLRFSDHPLLAIDTRGVQGWYPIALFRPVSG